MSMGLPYIPPRAESILLTYYLLGSALISASAEFIPSVIELQLPYRQGEKLV